MVSFDVQCRVLSNKGDLFLVIRILSDDINKSMPFQRDLLQKFLSWIDSSVLEASQRKHLDFSISVSVLGLYQSQIQ